MQKEDKDVIAIVDEMRCSSPFQLATLGVCLASTSYLKEGQYRTYLGRVYLDV